MRLLRVLFCRHRFEPFRPEGREVSVFIVGGLKVLHRCQKCSRLKWLKP